MNHVKGLSFSSFLTERRREKFRTVCSEKHDIDCEKIAKIQFETFRDEFIGNNFSGHFLEFTSALALIRHLFLDLTCTYWLFSKKEKILNYKLNAFEILPALAAT